MKNNTSLESMIGRTFSRIKVISLHHRVGGGAKWNCLCSCGTIFTCDGYRLKKGIKKSCGCLLKEKRTAGLLHQIHKMGGKVNGKRTRPYVIWTNLIQRCTNPKNKSYSRYGGRGISVCKKWLKFENFWNDMKHGYGSNLSLDRINNDLGYEPSNCRWTTALVQASNKRNNRRITALGLTMTMVEWSRKTGANYGALKYRLDQGWNPNDAMTMPYKQSSVLR